MSRNSSTVAADANKRPTLPNLDPIAILTRDIRNAAITLDDREARFLVDSYYQMQDNRIRAAGQVRSMRDEPHKTLAFFGDQAEALEKQIQRALDAYSGASRVGRWSRSICGIGPVLAAGLMAHIDITQAPTAGHIWSYAGLNPDRKWEKGQKRPHNAELKKLCWKIGESFVKVKGRDNDVYGKIYELRKQYEKEKNDRGEYREMAARILKEKNFSNDTKAKAAYIAGKLPDGHLHARAKRYAVKIFLSHWQHVAYLDHYGKAPPEPFAMAILGHAHKIEIPNLDVE